MFTFEKFQFHEKDDSTKHCALSRVKRWTYIIVDHLGVDLGIELVAGKNMPLNVNLNLAGSRASLAPSVMKRIIYSLFS